MARLSEKEIVVMSSSRTRKAMKEWIGALTKDLIRESHAGHLSERLDEQLTIMLKYFNSLCAAEKSQSDQVAAPSRTRTEATQVQHDWSRILALNKN